LIGGICLINLNLLEDLEGHFQTLEEYVKKLKLIQENKQYQVLIKNYDSLSNQLEEIKKLNEDVAKDIRKYTRQVDETKYKLSETTKLLYEGSINDIKQLNHLEKEKSSLEDSISKTEDFILELMEKNESMDHDIQIISNDLKIIKKEIIKDTKYTNRIVEELSKVIQEEKDKIEVTKRDINENILNKYILIRSKKGKGIGIVENQICSSCHMHIAKNIIDKIKLGKEITTCESCGRILILREDELNEE